MSSQTPRIISWTQGPEGKFRQGRQCRIQTWRLGKEGPLGVGRRGTGHYRDSGYRQEIVWVRTEILPETIFAIGLVCVGIFHFSSLIHFFSILLLCGRSKIIDNQQKVPPLFFDQSFFSAL